MNNEVARQSAEWPEAMIAVAGIVFIMTVAVVVIWQIFSTARAKMSIEREKAYRALVESNDSTQRKLLEQQTQLANDVSALRASVTELETILKDVR